MARYQEGATYRLTSGVHYRPPGSGSNDERNARRNRARVTAGDTFQPTEAEFQQNEGRLALVDTPSADPDLEDLTVSELEEVADELGLGEDDIEGTGQDGRVLKADWVGAIRDARD